MINRMYFKCNSCDGEIITRTQVGYEEVQPHTFACPHCGTAISIKLLLNEPPCVYYEHDDSCTFSEGSEKGIIVNLGVGFLIPESKKHSEHYFPALDVLHKFRRELAIQNPSLLGSMQSGVFLEGFPGAVKAWSQLEKACRFRLSKKKDLEDRHLSNFFEVSGFPKEDLKNTLFSFFLAYAGPAAKPKFMELVSWIKSIRERYPEELLRLIKCFYGEIEGERLREYVEICSEYFSAHNEYEQAMLYVRYGVDIPKDSVVASNDFDSTKMFYGNAFELLGTHLDIIAALNNVDQGRAYDKMLKMDLSKYREIKKAGRTECLKTNSLLTCFFEEYDSVIRNASHHRWFRLSDDRREISYRSGGTGARHVISYADYVYRCNKIFSQIIILAALELFLMEVLDKEPGQP